MSLTFGIAGVVGIIYLMQQKKRIPGLILILAFYTLMELLQTLQYQITNECDNPINVFLTEVAYVFVIVQPLIWNMFFYANAAPNEALLFMSGIALATVWVLFNVAGRVLYTPANAQTSKDSVFASNKVCTYRDISHLYWKWNTANLGDLNANFLMHLMIWFIPALISLTQRTTASIILAGAAVSALYAAYVGQAEAFTAAWCYISIPIVYLACAQGIAKGDA
jgi:hypothetical protein